MCKLEQIRIVQDGTDVFAVDTITWPNDTFRYPVVYTAAAMSRDSYDAKKIGWKWINRPQYEWLLQHYKCMVGCITMGPNYGFYCHNHQCFEKSGKDWPHFPALDLSVYTRTPEQDHEEEREV